MQASRRISLLWLTPSSSGTHLFQWWNIFEPEAGGIYLWVQINHKSMKIKHHLTAHTILQQQQQFQLPVTTLLVLLEPSRSDFYYFCAGGNNQTAPPTGKGAKLALKRQNSAENTESEASALWKIKQNFGLKKKFQKFFTINWAKTLHILSHLYFFFPPRCGCAQMSVSVF